jgi:hypothetical protein
MGDLQRLLSEVEFRPSSDFGFILSHCDSTEVSGQCITRFTEVQSIATPFGAPEVTSYVNYDRVSFCFTVTPTNALLLRIDEPPRSLSHFITALESIGSRRLFLASQALSIESLSAAMGPKRELKLTSLTMSSVVYGKNLVGKAIVSAIEGRTLEHLGILHDTPHRVDAYAARIFGSVHIADISVSASQILSIKGAEALSLRAAIEHWLVGNHT